MEIQLLRSIFLLRHGQEARGTNHRLGGPLTELGRMQAERAGERLRHYPIDAIYASTLRRAAETAEIVARRLPSAHLALTDDLWECTPLLSTPFDELLPERDPERVSADQARCAHLYEQFLAAPEGETILLVCHGNLIRYLLCRALKLPGDAWLRFAVVSAGWTGKQCWGSNSPASTTSGTCHRRWLRMDECLCLSFYTGQDQDVTSPGTGG